MSADSEMADDLTGGRTVRTDSLSGAARKTTRLHLPGMSQSNTRSLFIFSEDNFIRKYAQIIIEWGYPLNFIRAVKFSFTIKITKMQTNENKQHINDNYNDN